MVLGWVVQTFGDLHGNVHESGPGQAMVLANCHPVKPTWKCLLSLEGSRQEWIRQPHRVAGHPLGALDQLRFWASMPFSAGLLFSGPAKTRAWNARKLVEGIRLPKTLVKPVLQYVG